MKGIRIECDCKAGEKLEIGDFGDGQLYVSITPYKHHKTIFEVIINRKDIKKLVDYLKGSLTK